MAAYDTFKVVNGSGEYTLPTPKFELKYTEEDLQLEAWRDESGKLHKVQARTGLRRVDLEWPYLTDEQLSYIRTALKTSEYFRFIYYNSDDGMGGEMSEAYSGNLTYTLYSLRYGEAEWINVKVAIIER